MISFYKLILFFSLHNENLERYGNMEFTLDVNLYNQLHGKFCFTIQGQKNQYLHYVNNEINLFIFLRDELCVEENKLNVLFKF